MIMLYSVRHALLRDQEIKDNVSLFPPFYTGIPQVKAANNVTHPVIIGNLSGTLNNVKYATR
jgi:hypothetical protein